jgi:hypothetical protein
MSRTRAFSSRKNKHAQQQQQQHTTTHNHMRKIFEVHGIQKKTKQTLLFIYAID